MHDIMLSLSPETWVYIGMIGVLVLMIWGVVILDEWLGKRKRQKEIRKAWEVYFK